MGFIGPSKSEPKDLLETNIVKEPNSNAQRMRNRVFRHFVKHRDDLGFPKGTKSYPFFVCSNDMCAVALGFIELVTKNKEKPCAAEIMQDVPNILKLLIRSYEDACTTGCCGPSHSVKKEQIVEMYNQLKAVLGQQPA